MPRFILPGNPMHVIHRGNNRSPMFLNGDDYRYFMIMLREASHHARCSIHAYVLMGNHVHLLLTPAHEHGPARMMQSLGRRYVRYFNKRHKRTGTLFEGRYRSSLIESERYYFACSRYIELNPVRAGMVNHPGKYRWSSFHHNAIGTEDSLVTHHDIYRDLGQSALDRQAVYRGLFETHLDEDVVTALRCGISASSAVGSVEFQERVGSLT